jgi:hypothetical protein
MEEITLTVAKEEDTAVAAGRNFNLTSYAKANQQMIATNERAYNSVWESYHSR